MVRRSHRANVRILAILILAIAIVEKRNCEDTPVNRHNRHRYPQCHSSKDFPENCERPHSPIRLFRTIKDSPLIPSDRNFDVSVTIKPQFTGKFQEVPAKVNDAQGKIPVVNSIPFKAQNKTSNAAEDKNNADSLHSRRKRSTPDDTTDMHVYIDSGDNSNGLKSLKQVLPINYSDGNNIDNKSGMEKVAGGTLLDLENPAYSIDSAVYEDNEENTHVRVKRDKTKYERFYQEPSYPEQKYIEDLADSFPPVLDNKNELIEMKKRENNKKFNTSFNFTSDIHEGMEQLRETTNFPHSPINAPFTRNKYLFSNESKTNVPNALTEINSTGYHFGGFSNLTNDTTVVSDANSITTLTKFPTNDESGLKIGLDDIYPEIPSGSAESAPLELIRRKRDDYDKEYAEKETIESTPNKKVRSFNDFAQEQENVNILEENDREYDDYYAERPRIRSEREVLNNQRLNTENIEEKNSFDADDYVIEDDRSDPGAIENQPGAPLLRRKRYGRTKVYSELYPLEARSNLQYNLPDDFRQQRNTAKISQRSDFSNAEKSKVRFNDEKPSSSFSEVDKTADAKENVYGGNDLNADEEQSRYEYRPLHNNRRQIRGKFSRYRRRIPMKTMRRAFRRAKKPSRKRKGKKHKRRKNASSKRSRKAAGDEHLGRRSSRIGSPRVVDEIQVESKIEKRESSDGKTEIEVAKRNVNFGLLQPGKMIGLQEKHSPADLAHLSDEMNFPKEENLDQKRRDVENTGLKGFGNANEGLKNREENLNDVSGKMQDEEKEMSSEEGQKVREKSDNVQDTGENMQENLQSIQDEASKVEEGAESNEKQASLKDEEKAALDLDVRIKRLIDTYRDTPLSLKDVKEADLKKDGETDSIIQSATNDKRERYSKESEENSKVRFKRHEIGARKHTSRNNVDMKELKYYENVHEPEETAVQEAPQKENTPPEKFRDDRAVKSIGEIRELAEKLVSKATELQSYVSDANKSPVKRSKTKVNVREVEGCYSNATKISAPTTERESKIVERCVGSSSSKTKIIDLGEREKQRFAEEYSTRQLKSEKAKPAEKYRMERAFERGVERRKRKSRKWDRWTDWSSCSVTCGKGRQIRWRHCLRDCNTAETEMEEKACQLPACPPGKFLGIF